MDEARETFFFSSEFVTFLKIYFPLLQEGDRAFSASPETRVLCQTGHEGHPHGPAHDLYTSHRLHGQLHEKVSHCLFKIPLRPRRRLFCH